MQGGGRALVQHVQGPGFHPQGCKTRNKNQNQQQTSHYLLIEGAILILGVIHI
jgi:hypothetical protein